MIRIGLNAGHGMNTAGKRCLKALDANETREWYLNQRILNKVLEILARYEVEVFRYDDPSGRRDIPLKERTTNANNDKLHFYLAIHTNAGINGGSGGGIAVYRHPDSSSASVSFQKKIYDKLIQHTGLKGNRSTPLAKANLHEVRETRMPSLLLELGFMDSRVDVPIILGEMFANQSAQAIAEFLTEEFELKEKFIENPVVAEEPKKDFVLPDGEFFRVVVGSYNSRNNAEDMQKRLADKGFESFLTIFKK